MPKGRTQVDDRFARPVFLDQPAGAHLQGFDIGGILGQHLFDPRACADTVARRLQHLCQHDFDFPGLIAGVGSFQNGLDRSNRLVPLARLEIKRRIQGAIEIGIGGPVIGLDQPIQLGLCSVGARVACSNCTTATWPSTGPVDRPPACA